MQVERVFLGWDGHALPRAAAWLVERFGAKLAEPIVVTPTGRSGRRLLELLVEAKGGALDAVPQIVTPASLPELLYAVPESAALADDWTSALVRAEALRATDRAELVQIVPEPPADDDLPAWWGLARRLTSVVEGAAAAGLALGDIVERIVKMKLDDRALHRLEVLRRVEADYLARLDAIGLRDTQRARLDAIAERACRSDLPIVLVATADLSRQLARMLEQVDAPVVALIHAPDTERSGFDELGRFVAAHWQHHAPPIDDAQLVFVDRPMDQARQVVTALAAASPATDAVTIGLGDPALGASVRRAVEHAGAAARDAAGRALHHARPVTLLRSLGRFAGAQRFDDFAALLRHPDVLAYLGTTDGVDDWLAFMDEYATRHLQGRMIAPWLGERAETMRALWDRVAALLPDASSRPPADWAKPIALILQTIYPGELSRHEPAEHDLFAALQALGSALGAMAGVIAEVPPLTFAQAVSLLLQQIERTSVPEPARDGAIEMMGWLELPLDDADTLILTGVNEGHVPDVSVSDAWLPDTMKRSLGMPDAGDRFAREVYLLTAMLHSRDVTLIAGRMSADNDPLAPSRLLLMGDDDELVRRVAAFYQEHESPAVAPLLATGESTRFLVPLPQAPVPPIGELSVTAFREYLACPYRFYLKFIKRLTTMDDRAVELEPSAFGTLAHEVLDDFAAADDVRDLDRSDAIAAFLSQQLDAHVRRAFGGAPRTAVRVQVEMLRHRLHAFATHQAQLRREGWRIVYWEGMHRDEAGKPLRRKVALDVDGAPFTLTGRIDRIDRHEDGRYRILDYKTADTAAKPDRKHRRGDAWVDLQLPLYRDLAAALLDGDEVDLGYINLPKQSDQVGVSLATWDEALLIDARETAWDVIRKVRAGVFWPPLEPPVFDDGLAAICADEAFDRAGLIDLSERAAT